MYEYMNGNKMNRYCHLWSVPLALWLVLQISSCGNGTSEIRRDDKKNVEIKVETLLAQMTLEEKIGQMSQVRHFSDIDDGDVRNKFIGSVIHTDGPTPGNTAKEWQARFTELQQEALSTRLGIPLIFGVDAVHGQNTFDGATIFPHNIGMGSPADAR